MLKPSRSLSLRLPRSLAAVVPIVSLLVVAACASSGDSSDSSDGADGRSGGQADTMAAGGDTAREPGETSAVRISVFDGGEIHAAEMSGDAAQEIADYLCACIEKTEMVLRVAMITESIDEIKATERGIEVMLPEPRELTAGNSGQVLSPTRLLVPLTGKHAATPPADNLTILHGAPEYSPGPLVVKSGRDSLLQLLSSHGVD